MSFQIHDYGKVYNNGTKYVLAVLDGSVVIQEKVDGSQFSFALVDGELVFRSRKQQMHCYAYEGMFEEGIKAIEEIKDKLTPNLIYSGEYLRTPKHNALKYDRVPTRHVILFDLEDATTPDLYFPPYVVREEAERLGLECVPTFFEGTVTNIMEQVIPLLKEKKPTLGGEFIEGVVIKNYERPTMDGKFMKAKIVAEDFREVHKQEWGKANPSSRDIVVALVEAYRVEARWNKAIQHLQESGQLQDAPQDIGPLLKAVNQDVLDECTDEIKEILFKHFWKDISRGITRGLPEWYKRKLAGVEIGIDA